VVYFLMGFGWASWAMLVVAAGSPWFMPFGTLLSLLQIVLCSYLS
jgi:hypothetical protein